MPTEAISDGLIFDAVRVRLIEFGEAGKALVASAVVHDLPILRQAVARVLDIAGEE